MSLDRSYPLVKIVWRDATSTSGWHSIEEAVRLQPARVESVGWLIASTSERIVLAHGLEEDEAIGVMVIPRGWVEDSVVLEAGRCPTRN